MEKDIENEEFIEEETSSGGFRKFFFTLILIIVLMVVYARYIGTTGLIMKEYSVSNSNLPKSFNGFKVVHFSDFHYGRTTDINSLKKLVKEINSSKPDLVFFTGDFIDKDKKVSDDEITNIINELTKIDSTYGNYYVTGNHDIKFKKYEEMMNNSNFINLDDKAEIITNKSNESILISGSNYKSDLSYLEELFKNELSTYKINIMHTPDSFDDIKDYNFNLVLAGHSHNGQVTIPFYGAVYKVNGAKKYYKPYYKNGNTDFYISSGIGTSTFDFRLFNRPSFNLYRLKNSD